MTNNDTRRPTLTEIRAANERASADRLRDSLKRANDAVQKEFAIKRATESNKRKAWLTFYGFPIETDDDATPSPDSDESEGE